MHLRISTSLIVFAVLSPCYVVLVGCSRGAGSGGTADTLPVAPPAAVVTTTVLATTPNPAPLNTAVSLTAKVSAASGTPSGSVTFYAGTTLLGMVTLANGTGTLPITTFSASTTYSLTANYAGGSGFAASTSAAVSQVIQAAPSLPTINATGSFDLTAPNQTISGFGGAEAFYVNYLNSHPNKAQIFTALFDPVKGLGLTYLRVQNQYYLYTGTNATSFDTDTPMVVASANAAAGKPLTVLMSSWTPPAAIKSNNDVNHGGTLNTVNGGYNYAGFAQFWHDSLAAYAALGVTPDSISIQNEPDFTASYVSCRFNPTEAPFQGTTYAGYDKAFAAVSSAIQTLPSVPTMVGPEPFSTSNLIAYATALEGELPESSEIAALGHHLYNVSSTDPYPTDGLVALQTLEADFPTPQKWMTEYYDAPGFNTAWTIHNALAVGNDNAYFYWGLAWPTTQLTDGQSADQQGLLYLDNPFASQTTWAFPQGWSYNDSYYAFKHFSYFVRPGYIRYNATVTNADELISAYRSPDTKTIVVVVMNTSASATDVFGLNAGSTTYSSSTVYRSTFSTAIATGERWSNQGSLPAGGLTLPPQSVATIVLQQ